jgi:L-amino acid N-acyltransferase YncA
MTKLNIAEMSPADWPEVESIYIEGLETGLATFEIESPGWENWDSGHLKVGRLVAKVEDKIVGWAALSAVSKRQAYKGVAEVSIYIGKDFRGKGVGKKLFGELITLSERAGFWTLQSSVFKENVATIALHKSMGFREIGYREKIGQLNGVWRDTVLLERRSKLI